MYERESTLDCQACGDVLKQLTPAEAQAVADNPYNYIFFCAPCEQSGYHIDPDYYF